MAAAPHSTAVFSARPPACALSQIVNGVDQSKVAGGGGVALALNEQR